MKESKLKAYIGFAIKSNKVIFGYDKLFENKKNPKSVIICSTLNEKNTNKVIDFCKSRNIICHKLINENLGNIISRNCKVLAICDENLSHVICTELELLNGNNKVGEGNIGK